MTGSSLEATIFIAEDNPILLQGLDRALSANGYTVVSAEDGVSMLQLLDEAANPPDLLLLDMMMPQMSGLEVLEVLQRDARWKDLPILLITAAADETLPGTAIRRGAADVLIKPFRLGDLLTRIEQHVRRYRELRSSRATIPAVLP